MCNVDLIRQSSSEFAFGESVPKCSTVDTPEQIVLARLESLEGELRQLRKVLGRTTSAEPMAVSK